MGRHKSTCDYPVVNGAVEDSSNWWKSLLLPKEIIRREGGISYTQQSEITWKVANYEGNGDV